VKKSGRQFALIIMLMVASMTIISTQAKPRDLQTELTKFWSDKAEYNKHVWQLNPQDYSETDVYPNGGFIIKTIGAGKIEQFTFNNQSNGPVEFDSDIYKISFDKSLPMVKGTIVSLVAKYNYKKTYIGIVFDNRIIGQKTKSSKNQNQFKTDEGGQPYYEISQTGFNKSEPGDYDTGIPVIKYGANGGNTTVISPDFVNKVFEVAHPYGNYMEDHQGQTLDAVSFEIIEPNDEVTLKFNKELKDCYAFNLIVSFSFGTKREHYQLFKDSSGYLLVDTSFEIN